jgi:hypothetical protein
MERTQALRAGQYDEGYWAVLNFHRVSRDMAAVIGMSLCCFGVGSFLISWFL